jgi:hypothetical protein
VTSNVSRPTCHQNRTGCILLFRWCRHFRKSLLLCSLHSTLVGTTSQVSEAELIGGGATVVLVDIIMYPILSHRHCRKLSRRMISPFTNRFIDTYFKNDESDLRDGSNSFSRKTLRECSKYGDAT